MLDKLEFLISEALMALRRNGWMTFAAISTVAVSLFLIGGLAYSYLQVQSYAEQIPGKFTMRVFLKEGTTGPAISKTASEIRAIPGVKAAFWIPRDKAWAKKQQEDPELTRGIENPFPDAFKVEIKELKDSDEVVAAIHKISTVVPGEEGVVYFREEQRLIDQGLQLMRWLGTTVGGLLFLTAGVLIYNAIRLTVYSRRREIRIMQLVGASRITVQVPFLIEGIIHGVLGGILSALIIYACKIRLDVYMAEIQGNLLGKPPVYPMGMMIGILGSIGAIYGLLCSLMAVRRPMKES